METAASIIILLIEVAGSSETSKRHVTEGKILSVVTVYTTATSGHILRSNTYAKRDFGFTFTDQTPVQISDFSNAYYIARQSSPLT